MPAATICGLLHDINFYIIDPLFLLLFTLAFLLFVFGVVEFLWGLNAGSKEEGKQNGKRHMLWGVIGLFLMFAAFNLVPIIINTVGGNIPNDCVGSGRLPAGTPALPY